MQSREFAGIIVKVDFEVILESFLGEVLLEKQTNIHKKITLVLLSVLCVVGSLSFAGGVDAFEQNKRIGRSVNIIGYDPIWKSRDQGRFEEKHFKLIKEAGFDSVRINLHPFRKMDRNNNYKLHDSWLEVLDWAVANALKNKLTVILDLHEFNSLGEDPVGRKVLFISFWEQIAPRFKDAPDSVIFEILNEPCKGITDELWDKYYREALAIIRRTNPTRTVIIGPAHWNNITHLEKLKLPEDDRNIIATVHYYSPMSFTHQGAPWSIENKDRLGVKWLGTENEKQAVISDFQNAQSWSKKHKRPLLLGEFGAYDKAEMDSRARWTSFVTRTAESLGWSWAYWQFDSDFIVYDIDKDKWVEPIRDALIPR